MSDSEEDDVLAAEYVLGTLDAEERSSLDRRLVDDPTLRRHVGEWEDRFSPLLGLYREVPPPPHVLSRVTSRLGDLDSHSLLQPDNVVVLRRSVQRWRLVAGALTALAAALIAWIVVGPTPNQTGRFVAVLQKDAASPAILLDVDIGARRAMIRQVSTDRPADKSYELWLINPEVGGPRSLGILNPQGVTKASLASYDAAVIARATYAITVEPAGGSPSGIPSGQPILSGKLVDQGN